MTVGTGVETTTAAARRVGGGHGDDGNAGGEGKGE